MRPMHLHAIHAAKSFASFATESSGETAMNGGRLPALAAPRHTYVRKPCCRATPSFVFPQHDCIA